MPPRRKLPRRSRGRSWRAGPHPGRSVLTKGRRSASRRANRFSPLQLWRPAPQSSPLQKIPTLAAWLAMRDRTLPDVAGATEAC